MSPTEIYFVWGACPALAVSHSLLDSLWSAEAMEIIHDGCEANDGVPILLRRFSLRLCAFA